MKLIIIILIIFLVLHWLMLIINFRCLSESDGPGSRLKVVALLLLQLQRFGNFLVFLYLNYPLEFLCGVREGLLVVVRGENVALGGILVLEGAKHVLAIGCVDVYLPTPDVGDALPTC